MTTPLLRLLRVLLCVLAPLAFASSAHAAFELNVNAAEPADREAGKFADLSVSVSFPGDSTPKSVVIDAAGGQLAALNNATKCPLANVLADTCPASSLLGSALLRATALGIVPLTATGSLYLIPVTGTEPARLAVIARPPIGDRITAFGTLRLRGDGTFGIRAELFGLPRTARLSLFGAPLADVPVEVDSIRVTLFGRTSQNGSTGLFFNPTQCTPAIAKISAVGWNGETASDSAGYTPTNCDRVSFAPKVKFTPESSAPGTPPAFGLDIWQDYDPTAPRIFSNYAAGRLVLPAGVSVNAAVNSDGTLAACTDAQFEVTKDTPEQCPAGSQVGTVNVLTPILPEIMGRAYLALPSPEHPEDLARLFVVAEQSRELDGARVKFAARMQVDPATGVVSAALDVLPNVAVERFSFQFRGGSAPVTRQPLTCGNFPGSVIVRPTTGAPAVTVADDYTVDQECDVPRTPASVTMTQDSTQAGALTALTARVAVQSRSTPTSLRLELPPGLLGQLAGIPLCALADAAAGNCSAASRVGSIEGFAGQSVVPGTFPGSIYLTPPPTSDAVAGMSIAIPAVVGPISLGELRVPAAITVRSDVGVNVVAEIPTNLRGIPFDFSALRMRLDRPNFIRNPSGCGEQQAQLGFGTADGPTTASGAVTVTGCDKLPWNPSMRLALGPNASDLAANGKPVVDVHVEPGPGGAALRDLTATLPAPLAIDLVAVNRAVCPTIDSIRTGACTNAPVGTVSIDTPVFDTPVRGTVRLARVTGKVLPAVVIVVRDRLSLDLVGLTGVGPDGRIIVDFSKMPDAPIRAIDLRLDGGTNGVVKLGGSACQAASLVADSTLVSQHGAKTTLAAPVTRPCTGVLAGQGSSPAVALTMVQVGKRMGFTAAVRSTQPVTRFTVTLPSGSRINRGLASKLRLTVGGKIVRPKRVTTTARTLSVVLRAPASRLRVTTPVGTLTASSALTRSLRTSSARAALRAQFAVHERGGAVRTVPSKIVFRAAPRRSR